MKFTNLLNARELEGRIIPKVKRIKLKFHDIVSFIIIARSLINLYFFYLTNLIL